MATTEGKSSEAPTKPAYELPRKQMTSPLILPHLFKSGWFVRVAGFIEDVSEAVVGVPGSLFKDPQSMLPICNEIIKFLGVAGSWIDEIPLVQQSNRFGNQAFRAWMLRLAKETPAFMDSLVKYAPTSPSLCSSSSSSCTLAAELGGYFLEGFGNATRIDYGSGHELAFISFLAALRAEGLFALPPTNASSASTAMSPSTSASSAASEATESLPQQQSQSSSPPSPPSLSSPPSRRTQLTERAMLASLGTRVFDAYLVLTRKLQSTYWLEPAGSKGAWGLDDYQFLPFLWGAAQLAGANIPFADPNAAFSSAEEVKKVPSGSYLFLDAISFVQSVKTGSLQVHSPCLHSLAGVPTWAKVTKGLCRMYGGEVLSKFPVDQHIVFGSILPLNPLPSFIESNLPSNRTASALAASFAIPANLLSTKDVPLLNSVSQTFTVGGVPSSTAGAFPRGAGPMTTMMMPPGPGGLSLTPGLDMGVLGLTGPRASPVVGGMVPHVGMGLTSVQGVSIAGGSTRPAGMSAAEVIAAAKAQRAQANAAAQQTQAQELEALARGGGIDATHTLASQPSASSAPSGPAAPTISTATATADASGTLRPQTTTTTTTPQ